MQVKYLDKLTKMIVLSVLCTGTSCMYENGNNIVIIKMLRFPIKELRTAEIDVQCINSGYNTLLEKRLAKNAGFIEMEISTAIGAYEIDKERKDEKAKYRIICLYKNGWGIPRLGRHFNIDFRHISEVNIKVVNLLENIIEAEVEYKRHIFKSNKPGFIKQMILALKSNEDEYCDSTTP